MNRSNKSYPVLPMLIAGALALSGCDAFAPAPEPPLAGAAIGGDFALTNSKGETVRWGDFAGKYRIVYFGYAFCPDICPTDMQRVAQGLKVLKAKDADKAAKITPIFITIDPERDTRQVVGEFAAAFSPDIVGLTGTPEQIAATAKTFKVFFAKGEPVEGGGYLMDHSNIVYLFGPDGAPLATLPVDQGPDAVAAELDKWVS
ncbi:SCO family protein [Porphyrobacter sp. LM 6]|jgi:protein SCO1/2|uniref:SCO family protein n=1 Tax=Porphyrobacter sp. LM 6 TaxID=1896196 RepID=UPI000847B3BF|nr:SCO family protein [Porphyrobacter sp. LM 6]AOL95763.1 protein SCO1/2 [Porphyrobacter sp. LM 6]